MQARPPRPTSRPGLATQADRQQGSRVRHRDGRLDADVLHQGGRDMRQDAASGVDQGRAQADEQPRDEAIHRRGARLQQQRSRATRVSRHARPTGEGTPRPLGRPAVEAQRRHLAVAPLLEAIDAQACRRGRDGDRPPVGALEAVDPLTLTRHFGREAWGVEADLTQVGETIAHDGMVRMGAERMDEGALRRLIRQWRTAGGRDTDGQGRHPGTGTRPGGTVSPGLAPVFLPDGLEWWCAKGVKRPCRGDAWLIRDADDCGGACADHAAAERLSTGLGPRRGQGGLERSGATPRILPCRRPRLAGHTSVEWRGGACRWGKDRTGQEHRTRRTARQTRRPAGPRVTAWCKAHRHRRVPGLVTRLHATRRGYDHDDGVHGNAASLTEVFNRAIRMRLTWRHRRRPRHRDTGPGDKAVLERVQVARPRIVGRPQTRQAPRTTYADLRPRVFLQSPVREHRTPGSVRGPSGNRRSYRDGLEVDSLA